MANSDKMQLVELQQPKSQPTSISRTKISNRKSHGTTTDPSVHLTAPSEYSPKGGSADIFALQFCELALDQNTLDTHDKNAPAKTTSMTVPSSKSLSPIPSFLPNPRRIRKSKLTRSLSMSTSRPIRLFLASLGNPPPYQNTRHSAAHLLLKSFAKHLGLPSLLKDRTYGGAGTISGSDIGRPEYTLWQSGSLMNTSGAGLLKAWKQFESQYHHQRDEITTGLVVLHDDLEASPATLKLRRSGVSSAKGHNGIKSVQTSLASAGLLTALSSANRILKIGIGIGRPVSRAPDDVSAYVLGQLSAEEKWKIESAAEELELMLNKEMERIGRS